MKNLEIIEAAAIFIQKVYRGHRTRKLLREHLRNLLVEEMIRNGDDLTGLYEMGLGNYVEEYLKSL